MLDTQMKTALRDHLGRLRRPVQVIASLDNSTASTELRALLSEIAELSDQVQVAWDGDDARKPSFLVTSPGRGQGVRFAGIPLGHEFTSLVLALLWTGGHPPKADVQVIEQIQAIEDELHFEVYMSLSCHNCPDVVQATSLMAVINPRVQTSIIDGALFQTEVDERQIMAVPSVYLNGKPFASGRMTLEEIVARLDVDSESREAARLAAKEPFDTLIVGGGPAGAAAAVYAARKGIRVGVVAERFGGQVNDTLAIENYISVLETDGPRLAAALEAQVRHYGVDVMLGQRVERLEPAETPGGLHTIHLSSGASLRTRCLLLSTGARWRNVNVPGEQTYRNRGVAYCPHCDGPLFKGKRVAVIGGGNSGVEAAIDLAGIASHVTLLEFGDALRADAVLVHKLNTLANVRVELRAQTTEITGLNGKVDGLRWRHRESGNDQVVPLEGVFVQIGLVPNTEWLKDTLELTRAGEIVVDSKGHTNVPGVFAAGDCTTEPFKQIVVAAGAGASAALAAFEHLMRHPGNETAANPKQEAADAAPASI